MKVSTRFLTILAFATTILFSITSILSAQEVDSITDIRDGQRYRVVKIGDQWWTAENLKAAKYLNNDPIPTGHSDGDWANLETGAYAIYPHSQIDGLNSDAEVLQAYGALYNWYAVADSRGLCPVGWKVPTDAEWTTLISYAGGASIAGGKLKSIRTEPDANPRWGIPNEGATDEFGFSGLPGGQRNIDGYYAGIVSNGSWWSTTYSVYEPFATHSTLYQMGTNIDLYQYSMNFGFSIRCIRDNDQFGQFTYLIISDESFEVVNSIELTSENGSRKLLLINQGVEAVTITGITTSTGDFTVDIEPQTLAAGDSTHFTVTFNVTQPGEYNDQLVVESNDPYLPTINIPISAFNATAACGVISENTIWTKANSPYHLQDCNVAVAAGVTLTIEPGVTVIIDPTRQISVDGTLIAHGVEGDSITFRDNAGNGFNQIFFRSTGIGELSYFKIENAQNGLYIEGDNVIVSNGLITNCQNGISLNSGSARISSCRIDDNSGYGVYSVGSSSVEMENSIINTNSTGVYINIFDGNFLVKGNEIRLNDENGIFATWDGVVTQKEITGNIISNNRYGLSSGNSITVTGNTIACNTDYGLSVYSSIVSDNQIYENTGNGINASNSNLTNNIVTNNGGTGISANGYNEISYCTISGNTGKGILDVNGSNIQHCDIIDNGSYGIETTGLPTINYSNIHGNTGYNVMVGLQGSETIDATNNYWGTTSSTEIGAKIHDYYDDGVSVMVNYTPFAQQSVQFPRVIGTDASDITFTSALITAAVNPNNLETSVYIEYGLTSEYGTTVPTTPATLTGSENQTVTLQLTGLTLGTRYHFRVKAENASGISYSEPQTFTTAFHYITDIRDGQRYRVVKIGDQWWTAENLKAVMYLNNDPIPTGLTNLEWENTNAGAYAIYNNETFMWDSYGALYNGYVIIDPRGVCPIGWNVSNQTDWLALAEYAGGIGIAGGKLKSKSDWWHPNIAATDEYSFEALPGGWRSDQGYFGNQGGYGHWWSRSINDDSIDGIYSAALEYNSEGLSISSSIQRMGFGIRCVSISSLSYLIISNDKFEPVSTIELTSENANQKLYLINQGGEAVTITGISTSTPEFSVDIEPLTLAEGDSVHFTVTFNSNETGLYEDTLTIESDDPFQPNVSIPISGFNATTACGVISENTTWTKANSPYHLQDCNVAVAAGVTLTIEPGVTVIIDPTRQISVDGTLIAHGAEGDSITFRDNAGNGFSRLYLRSGSNVEMSYFRISGAQTGIQAESNTLSLAHGRITGGVKGVSLSGAVATIDNVAFSRCQENAIYATQSGLTLTNSILSDNYCAINAIGDTYGRIEGCTIKNNYATTEPDYQIASGIGLSTNQPFEIVNNTFTNNTSNAILVNFEIAEQPANLPYISNNTFTGNFNAANINYSNFTGNHIQNGISNGITAINSNIHNNTITDNGGYGIQASSSTLLGNEVTGNTVNGINVSNSNLTNNMVTNNGGTGISANGYNEISYCTVSGNTGDGILDVGGSNIQHCDIIDNGGDGIETSSLPTINHSNIHGNTGYNVRATMQGSQTIDATNNYWGTTTTTEIDAKIWDYNDDGVSVKVNYTPFAQQAVQFPRVIGTDVSDITFTSALITANVNPNNLETSVYIEYGLTSEYGTTVATTPATLTGSENQTVTLQLSDLTLGARYHYRIKAENATGITYSEPQAFTTAFHHITDIRDGQRYRVVQIGDQWWTAENLKAAKYLNNDPIPTGYSDGNWANLETGAYAIYPHTDIDGLNSEAEVLQAYGALYNWYAVGDERGLCPVGWKVPTDEEWTTLINYAGGVSIAGGKLKSTRTEPDDHPRWGSPNFGATDYFGFSAFPASMRLGFEGIFSDDYCSTTSYWWSISESANSALFCHVRTQLEDVQLQYSDKMRGLSVRCLKDGQFNYLNISNENFEPVNSIELTNENASQKQYLINQGGEAVTITSITTNIDKFTVNLAPLTLAAGDSVHLTVNFNAADYGVYEGTLTIESNDPFVPIYTIALAGEKKYYSPLATEKPATEVTHNSAVLNATVNPYGEDAQVWFQWGSTQEYQSSWQTVNATPGNVSGTSNINVTASISSLLPNTPYYFRIKVTNGYETVYSDIGSLTTLAKAPTVITQAVSNNTNTQATLNGQVNPHNSSTSAMFSYGLSSTVDDTWITTDIVENLNGNSLIPLSVDIEGLSSHTQYYFSLTAWNDGGSTTGDIIGFNTSAPIVNLQTASNIDLNSARLNATVNPNGYVTTYYFEYGLQPDLSDAIATSEGSLSAGSQAISVNADIGGLDVNAVYYFRVIATNTHGISKSSIGELHTQCNFNITCTKPTGESAICQGSSTNQYLTTSTTAFDYQWWVEPANAGSITGTGTTGIISWNPEFHGQASIYVRGFNGVCASIDSEPLVVTVNPLPSIQTISGNNAVCPGSYGNSYSVSPAEGNAYTWTVTGGTIIDGANAATVRIDWGNATGNYNLLVVERTVSTGCEISYGKEVAITGSLAPDKPVLDSKGRVNILYSTVNASSYQWYKNNQAIPDATKKFYVARNDVGSYTLRVSEGTCYAYSDPISVPLIAKSSEWESLMSLYPNPSLGMVNVDVFSEINGLMHIRVTDSNGRQIYLKKVYKGDYYHQEQILLSVALPGLYQVDIIIDDEIIDSQKIVIQ